MSKVKDLKLPFAKEPTRSSWWANISFLPNIKSDGSDMLRVESSLEALLVMKLLMDPKVKYVTSACNSKYIQSLGRRYTDDIQYTYSDDVLHLVEVKQSLKLMDEDLKEKIKLITYELTSKNSVYEVMTEHDICPGEAASNILRFFRHFYCSYSSEELEKVEKIALLLDSGSGISLKNLIDYLISKKVSYPAQKVWHLLAHKRLSVEDESKYINSNTLIWA
ncbi:hypothetical protein [Pseudoalteromonas spongiae]|uniref:hypothetical protein n=1 Tax=Pseudoalteromonas spongiae TaxID=298657 RepID=UPI00026CA932|nr:hypothetical protein [Pseudoalteromonas spongiae]ATD00831.1 hypothetical protein PSPO_b0880 [Pseudoalteromonas spongiae UST010723-006]